MAGLVEVTVRLSGLTPPDGGDVLADRCIDGTAGVMDAFASPEDAGTTLTVTVRDVGTAADAVVRGALVTRRAMVELGFSADKVGVWANA